LEYTSQFFVTDTNHTDWATHNKTVAFRRSSVERVTDEIKSRDTI